MANTYEIWTEPLSESSAGRPILVASITNTAATAIHTITVDDAIDSVWLTATNKTGSAVDLTLVLNPADDTVAGDVTNASLPFTIQANTTMLLLDGTRLRKGVAAYTIGAFAGSANDIAIIGHIVRKEYEEIVF